MPLGFIEGRILRELAGVLTLSMLLPGVAVAQDLAVSLDELLRAGSLQPGAGVYVTDAAGRRLKGTLGEVSSTGLVVTHRGQAWTVAGADVREIELQDPLANGIGYGMAAVAGPISAVCLAGGSHPGECTYTCCCTRFRSWRSAARWALLWTLSGTRRSIARPGRCKHPCPRSCRAGVSARRYRSLGEPPSRVTRFALVVSRQRSWGVRRTSRGAVCRRRPRWAHRRVRARARLGRQRRRRRPVLLGSDQRDVCRVDEDVAVAVVALTPSMPVVPP